MSKAKALTADARSSREAQREGAAPAPPGRATRETIESIAVAVILAFLFRAFVAEAFVIPTGSMAPTLMGQHKDVQCPECQYWYQAGASIEMEDEASDQRSLEMGRAVQRNAVIAATCPLCRYRQILDPKSNANQATFSGDRILVSKFLYDFAAPQRWDVIVFKYPFNAKQNFIKRLVGLPGETVRIEQGDVFVKQAGEEEFQMARKPDRKLKAMLQLVYDSKHLSPTLLKTGWPARWRSWEAGGAQGDDPWQSDDDGRSFHTQGVEGRDIWLRYRHIVPSLDDWKEMQALAEAGKRLPPPGEQAGGLITDFYAYNAYTSISRSDMRHFDPQIPPEEYTHTTFGSPSLHPSCTWGLHWVSDLALEADVEIQSDQGELLLQLTKGGVAYQCRIDIASGVARLSVGDGSGFVAADGTSVLSVSGQTGIRGAQRHAIRWSNVDAELRLWVDERRIEFDGPTTYAPRDKVRPVATLQDPGDLAPVGIGSGSAALSLRRLRVLRDVYYVATNPSSGPASEYRISYPYENIVEILGDPTTWEKTGLFAARGVFEQALGPDQFFPLGDNSPQSSDGRMWLEHFFRREMLIGRAVLIYWPHPWYRPIPYLPNIQRMRLIH